MFRHQGGVRIVCAVSTEARNVPAGLTAELLEEIGSQEMAVGEKTTARHRRETLAT